MQKKLIKYVKPVLNYLIGLQLRFDKGYNPNIIQLKEEIKKLLKNINYNINRELKTYSKIDKDTTMYILTVLADEIIINSNKWPFSKDWEALELDMFRTSGAAKKIFNICNGRGQKNPEIAELLYICFAMGFQKNNPQSKKKKLALYNIIKTKLHEKDNRLSPDVALYPKQILLPALLPPMFSYYLVFIVLILFIVFYIFTSQLMWHDSVELISTMSKKLTEIGY